MFYYTSDAYGFYNDRSDCSKHIFKQDSDWSHILEPQNNFPEYCELVDEAFGKFTDEEWEKEKIYNNYSFNDEDEESEAKWEYFLEGFEARELNSPSCCGTFNLDDVMNLYDLPTFGDYYGHNETKIPFNNLKGERSRFIGISFNKSEYNYSLRLPHELIMDLKEIYSKKEMKQLEKSWKCNELEEMLMEIVKIYYTLKESYLGDLYKIKRLTEMAKLYKKHKKENVKKNTKQVLLAMSA